VATTSTSGMAWTVSILMLRSQHRTLPNTTCCHSGLVYATPRLAASCAVSALWSSLPRRGTHILAGYNSVNGIPTCANPYFLQDILREEWGFGEGWVTYVAQICASVPITDLAIQR